MVLTSAGIGPDFWVPRVTLWDQMLKQGADRRQQGPRAMCRVTDDYCLGFPTLDRGRVFRFFSK